ncbi:MAG TPA: TetR/AcrR family transcriptional regulator [Fimbriiglobus sp.]|nr:TetR/AcrR family transcriptional regulator [Fimbriiglobus sp.]
MRNGQKRSITNGPAADSAVARRRRDEIVTAATEIIASEGLHRLSLARIEKRTGMTRGQLTYYFRAKEAILLAVFDRMLARMIGEAIADAEKHGAPKPGTGRAQDNLRHALTRMLSADHQCDAGKHELFALVHTFMAQVRHREDYREKLAAANAGWRQHLAGDIVSSLPANHSIPPAVLASVVMALFQGLSGQLAVDPGAFDRAAMLGACLRLLAPLFGATHE